MAVSKHSQALSVNVDENTWFADSGASEHMPDCREWFSTFTPIAAETWTVAVADDRNLCVLGTSNIDILLSINDQQKRGVLKNVLYVPDL